MPRSHRTPAWQRALIVLSGTVVATLTVVALYWAQSVLIPVALAVYFAFLLSPIVTWLRGRGLPRLPAVILVVTGTAVVVGGAGWLVARELDKLAAELQDPAYTENLKERAAFLRDFGKESAFDRIGEMVREISKTWQGPGGEQQAAPIILEPGSSWMNRLSAYAPWFLELLGGAALAGILVIFMLLKREDLRNRLISLFGQHHVILTTKVLDDIGHRISRFLLAQLILNAGYGLAIALGLFLIDVNHAILWGVLAGTLRYIPYIGAPTAALFPITLSLAQFTGWVEPGLVLALIIVVELVTNNAMEPWLYGKSMGVSEVALLVAAGFWTFLWGPIGLVLSGPLTVCLVVVGEYVPRLRFLAVLLGDQPALAPDVSYFQRLTAGDQDEAADIVQKFVKDQPPEQVFDGLLVPALVHARRAAEQDELEESEEQYILQATREIVDDLGAAEVAVPQTELEDVPDIAEAMAFRNVRNKVRILGCPARDELDALCLQMLGQLLHPAKWELSVAPVTLLASELLPLIEEQQPSAVVIGSLLPGGLAHTRYLCKRLRAQFPDLRIIVGRWGLRGSTDRSDEALKAAGADVVETALLDARTHLASWQPVMEEKAAVH